MTAAVFVPVLHTDFSPLDDRAMIPMNPEVTTPSWDNLAGFWAAPSFRIYMPLTLSIWHVIATFSHYGDKLWDGSYSVGPAAFKYVSVATHALAAAAAAWSLSAITRTRWPAVLGAMVFALHPAQVESVAWTTGLKDELCGLFSLLAVGLYVCHTRRNPASPWGDGRWWGAFACALLAMASKSAGLVLPAMLLAADWATRRCSLAKRLVSVLPAVLPAVASAMIIVATQGDSQASDVRLWQRPLVAADTYAFYLRKVVWPGAMAIDYGRRPSDIIASGAIWWTWLFSAAAVAGVLLTRSRFWVLAAALFVIPVLPVSGLAVFDMQQYSTVTDHYLYQPLFGIGLAVALLATWRPAVGGAVAAATCGLALMTHRECTAWQDIDRLYARILRANPRSWMARNTIADDAADRGDIFTARRLTNEAIAVNPDHGNTLDLISRLDVLEGKYRDAATHARSASQRVETQRLALARRLTVLGLRLNDRDVSESGLRLWQQIEPKNQYVAGMIVAIERSKREEKRAATTRSANLGK